MHATATNATRQAAPRRSCLVRSPVVHRGAISRDVRRNGLFGLGFPELAVIAGVTALIFGPSKLPELGKAAGQTAKSFQTAAKEFSDELKKGQEEAEESAEKKEISAEKKP